MQSVVTGPHPSFEITFSNLWTSGFDESGDTAREPLSALAGAGEHVHGVLAVLIQGRPLPALGFFGPDDVCFNEWARELNQLQAAMVQGRANPYVYDECEQGQPSYHFAPIGDDVLISVREGVGGGLADPNWSEVPCRLSDLTTAVEEFTRELQNAVVRAAGERGQDWIAEVLGE